MNKRQFHIRPAREEDAQGISGCMRALATFENTGPIKLLPEDIARDGLGRHFRVLVAEGEGGVIGMAAYYPGYDLATAAAGMHLADLFVEDRWRGQGVGKALMAALAEETLQAGGAWISWTVLTKNRDARLFYHRLGGQDVPVRFMAMGREKMRRLCNA